MYTVGSSFPLARPFPEDIRADNRSHRKPYRFYPRSSLNLATISQRNLPKQSGCFVADGYMEAALEKTVISLSHLSQSKPEPLSLPKSLKSSILLVPQVEKSPHESSDKSCFSWSNTKEAQTKGSWYDRDRTTVASSCVLQSPSKRNSITKVPFHTGDQDIPVLSDKMGMLESQSQLSSISRLVKATLSDLNDRIDNMESPLASPCQELASKISIQARKKNIAIRLTRLSMSPDVSLISRLLLSFLSLFAANKISAPHSEKGPSQ